jgi:hypothetical protein
MLSVLIITGQGCEFGGFYRSMAEDCIPLACDTVSVVNDYQENQCHIPEEQSPARLFRCFWELIFCWPCIIVHQYSETNMMHFLFSLLRINGLCMFQASLAHSQEVLHKLHLVYCVRVISVGCTRQLILNKLNTKRLMLVSLYWWGVESVTFLTGRDVRSEILL